MNIQWYPGHMVKTRREMQESLKLIDVVIELLDARIPLSSRNPDMDEIMGSKPRIVLLNKSELADEKVTREWMSYFKSIGRPVLEIDSITGKNINKVQNVVKESVKEKFDKQAQKGIIGRPVRALVAGIPNVGKSSFINKISAKTTAKTGDKPGVTRSKQWIKVSREFELMDTPGILWPKFDDERVALHLAFTRAIKDEILDIEELAVRFIEELTKIKPDVLVSRYKLKSLEDSEHALRELGRNRGCVISGGDIDITRASNLLFDDYRGGKLGRISLERPQELVGGLSDEKES